MKRTICSLAMLLFLANPVLAEEKKEFNLNYNLRSFFGMVNGNACINIKDDESRFNFNMRDVNMKYIYVKKGNTNVLNQEAEGANDFYVWTDSGTITYYSGKDKISKTINNDKNAIDILTAFKQFCNNKNKNNFYVINNGKIYSLNIMPSSVKGYNMKVDVSKLDISGIKEILVEIEYTGDERKIKRAKLVRSFYNSIDVKLND